jgi:lysylphosphatidylglycerol synthetase-like protein (DUF2156 family)
MKHPYLKIGLISLVIVFTLYCYWRFFRFIHWDKIYSQQIPWDEIFFNPEAHAVPAATFIPLAIIFIIVLLSDMHKSKHRNRHREHAGKMR